MFEEETRDVIDKFCNISEVAADPDTISEVITQKSLNKIKNKDPNIPLNSILKISEPMNEILHPDEPLCLLAKIKT